MPRVHVLFPQTAERSFYGRDRNFCGSAPPSSPPPQTLLSCFVLQERTVCSSLTHTLFPAPRPPPRSSQFPALGQPYDPSRRDSGTRSNRKRPPGGVGHLSTCAQALSCTRPLGAHAPPRPEDQQGVTVILCPPCMCVGGKCCCEVPCELLDSLRRIQPGEELAVLQPGACDVAQAGSKPRAGAVW